MRVFRHVAFWNETLFLRKTDTVRRWYAPLWPTWHFGGAVFLGIKAAIMRNGLGPWMMLPGISWWYYVWNEICGAQMIHHLIALEILIALEVGAACEPPWLEPLLRPLADCPDTQKGNDHTAMAFYSLSFLWWVCAIVFFIYSSFYSSKGNKKGVRDPSITAGKITCFFGVLVIHPM